MVAATTNFISRSAVSGLAAVAVALLGAVATQGFGVTVASAQAAPPSLPSVIAGPQRSPANVARDPYRHPLDDLTFFGVQPTSTVIEILPGGVGYWTEILAPYLKDHGRYIAANPAKDATSDEAKRENAAFTAKVAADPTDYAKIEAAEFVPGSRPLGPDGSADMVLTFRNIHNWMANGTVDAAFDSFYRVLKPGGVLGVEEHRANPDQPQDPQAKSGYVRQDYAIALAEKAGFRLAASSEANANPKDTKDYPAGVWTLPPTYRLKDQDHAKYAAIGESDRFLLKFVKPLSAP
ncbi:methyltransferase domain-containing protein [Lichenihabitans sp. PAMC28606]|uniref:class I SAM-dependent methyltransferase n=1 Tax=Lichenihabitans sp. PAMC28606 TaxID=2880932 RepID=UPI001D0B5242|nr:methyltransferase [Lichenihabitans sp. PAMC28606]UDL95967.1 methyltransferase domain-containing protein [Lichenihabitans sp. PAMC28606]